MSEYCIWCGHFLYSEESMHEECRREFEQEEQE